MVNDWYKCGNCDAGGSTNWLYAGALNAVCINGGSDLVEGKMNWGRRRGRTGGMVVNC